MLFKISPHLLGKLGESIVTLYLRLKGYFIWKRNWRSFTGEIDIIALQPRTLVFIEVKTRREEIAELYSGEAAVDGEKMLKIIKTAEMFREDHAVELKRMRINKIQYDVASVIWRSYRLPKISYKTRMLCEI